MRAASMARPEAISASSNARLRSISRLRTFFSDAMRSALTASSCAMRALAVASRAAISACSTVLVRSISRRCASSSLAMRASIRMRS
jgi:hypothetical protein